MAKGMLQTTERSNLADSLREFHTETGRSLLDLVDESPVLLVFLRHKLYSVASAPKRGSVQ